MSRTARAPSERPAQKVPPGPTALAHAARLCASDWLGIRPGNSARSSAWTPFAARPATWLWTDDTEAPIWNGTRTTFGCRPALSARPASHAAAGPETSPTVKAGAGGGAGAGATLLKLTESTQ